MAEPLRAVFRKPFPQQVAALRLRLGDLVPTARWDDIEKSAHDRAFMVAGAMKADLLADLGLAVDKAIAEGAGLEAFRKDFRAIVEKHGWHGWTGEGSKKGEAWRTRVIYRTNMRTSYMAGRYAQLTEGRYPFWVYRHGGSLEPRIQHLGWDGLILPPDHPFWATHFPPNGWGCSCRVFGARSREAAKRKGGDPGKKLQDGWQVPNAKTGAPSGIDKGWDYAPGASVAQTVSELAPKLNRLPAQPSIDLIQSWLRSELFAAWYAAPIRSWPLVRISDQDAEEIGASVRVAHLSARSAKKQKNFHPDIVAADYMRAQDVVHFAQTTHVERDPITKTLSKIYVWDLSSEGQPGYTLVVKATLTGRGLFITSYRRVSSQEIALDRELARLRIKAEKRKP